MSRKVYYSMVMISAGVLSLPALVRAADPVVAPAAPAAVAGPAAAGDDTESVKGQFIGEVNANNVLVRSGASENDYATMKLAKGDQVTVVGIKFNWLKIVPPDGSYSYVAKAYVQKHGDGSVGRVTSGTPVTVWAGSVLVATLSAKQCTVSPGDDVTILGENDDYYRIKPPADAFVWVNQNLVNFVRKVPTAGDAPVAPVPAVVAAGAAAGAGPAVGVAVAGPTTADSGGVAVVGPTTADSGVLTLSQVNPPSTMPAETVSEAEASFDKLETEFLGLSSQPLDEQPLEDLSKGYKQLVDENALPTSMKSIAVSRVSTLSWRIDAKAKLLEVKKEQADADAKLKALQGEQQDLQQHLAAVSVTNYVAIGLVEASSLQGSNGTLYRLTDPANGRTACYVRVNDPTVAGLIGKFAGVQGQMVQDPTLHLKVLDATSISQVDPTKINNGITATILPASMTGTPAAAAPAGE